MKLVPSIKYDQDNRNIVFSSSFLDGLVRQCLTAFLSIAMLLHECLDEFDDVLIREHVEKSIACE